MPLTPDYRTESADTAPEAEQLMIALARGRSSGEKSSRVWAMMEYVHNLAFAALRRNQPELSDDEIRFRLTARRLGHELTMTVYGEDPEAHVR